MGNTFSNEEIMSLTRDGLSRSDPDALTAGFFPAWAVVVWLISSKQYAY
jgi:hypothetical protein